MKYFRIFIQILSTIDTRPTKYFVYLVLAIIGLFFLAYMHNYNIVYIMMFFIFSLAGASSIIGRFNLYQIQATLLSSQNLFTNTASSYTLNISNANDERDSFVLELNNDEETVYINKLGPKQSQTINLHYTPTKRGLSHLPPLKIGSYFPLPHEILFKTLNFKEEVIIYPEAKGRSLDSFTSEHKSFIGEYDDFEGIRAYKQGEALSLIYWPSLAKNGPLMAKEFSLLHQSKHLNFYFSSAGKDDEESLSQLCLWAKECEQKNIPYSMHFPSQVLDSSKRSYHEILEFLALY